MFIITSPPLSYSPFLLSPPLSHLPLSHISPFLTPPPLSSSRCHVDYINDTKSVLDQAPRVINALLDLAVDRGERPSYHPPCHPPCHIPCHIPSHIPCHIPYHPPCHTPCHIPCHVLSHYPLTHCPPSPPISPTLPLPSSHPLSTGDYAVVLGCLLLSKMIIQGLDLAPVPLPMSLSGDPPGLTLHIYPPCMYPPFINHPLIHEY